MLDSRTIATVKSTIPLLTATGSKLAAHFYERMFKHNPELKNVFNLSNQFNGDQREALFNAICAYAANVDNLAVLLPAVEKIAQKHTSLNVQPEQYQTVGSHLLATLDEMFQPGNEVLEAWGKAYVILADVLINREEQIYHENESTEGGWRGLRQFRIKQKQVESDVICSFEFEPLDGEKVMNYKPGQYLTIYLEDDSFDNREIRHYSLTTTPNGSSYRIAIKRQPQGRVSTHMHNQMQKGDTVWLSPPHGDFFLDIKPATPVTLISAGVGLTPMLSMLHHLHQQNHNSPINWLHAAEHGSHHAFAHEVASIAQAMPNLNKIIWYREPRDEDQQGVHYHHKGFMDLQVASDTLEAPGMQFYVKGPLPFMQLVAKQLLNMGIDKQFIHYECFGPHKVI